MRGPVYEYGHMSSQWNRQNTAYIVSPVGAELGYLALQPVAQRVAHSLYERDEYGLVLYRPEYMREQRLVRGGEHIRCWFGLMQSHSLEILYEGIDSLCIMAEDDPHMTFHLEFPGRGVLSTTHVEQALKRLPSNVHVWRPKHEQPRTRRPDDTEDDDE